MYVQLDLSNPSDDSWLGIYPRVTGTACITLREPSCSDVGASALRQLQLRWQQMGLEEQQQNLQSSASLHKSCLGAHLAQYRSQVQGLRRE